MTLIFDETSGIILLEEISSKTLKKYNYEIVNKIETQIKEVQGLIKDIIEEIKMNKTEELMLNFAFLKFYRERCTRILKAYSFNRILLIDKISDLLSKEEIEIYQTISEAENSYLANFELNYSVKEPPIDLFIHVLCLEDCGIVFDNDECIELKKSRIYYIRKKSVEHLLKNNSLKIIN